MGTGRGTPRFGKGAAAAGLLGSSAWAARAATALVGKLGHALCCWAARGRERAGPSGLARPARAAGVVQVLFGPPVCAGRNGKGEGEESAGLDAG